MNPNTDIRYLVIIGIAVMLLLFTSFLVALIFSQRKKLKYQKSMDKLREHQQNQLIEAAVRSEEQERHRIAETLHDEVGAILSSAKLHLLGIKAAVLDERDQKLHEKGRELLNDVIGKVRGISHNLHSNILKEFGLNEAIRHFIRKVTEGAFLNATTALDDNYQTENPDNDISIYRMVQELVNNILKYAHASEFLISSTLDSNVLNLVIFHNGDGLTQEQFEELRYQKEGLGLKNIQNRVILLKGNIHFTRGEEGYRINIHVPVSTSLKVEAKQDTAN
ncbi:MAG: histidine kinase [Bacteroidota bacterium]|nr:histidine kinase [Bacteroidota bacterium]